MALTAHLATVPGFARQPPIRTPRGVFPSPRALLSWVSAPVGRAVAEILCRAPRPDLRLSCVCNRNVEPKRAPSVPDAVQWTENFADVLAGNADIVVQLIGCPDPAHEFIRRALLSGKSVVTCEQTRHCQARTGTTRLGPANRSTPRIRCIGWRRRPHSSGARARTRCRPAVSSLRHSQRYL